MHTIRVIDDPGSAMKVVPYACSFGDVFWERVITSVIQLKLKWPDASI